MDAREFLRRLYDHDFAALMPPDELLVFGEWLKEAVEGRDGILLAFPLNDGGTGYALFAVEPGVRPGLVRLGEPRLYLPDPQAPYAPYLPRALSELRCWELGSAREMYARSFRPRPAGSASG